MLTDLTSTSSRTLKLTSVQNRVLVFLEEQYAGNFCTSFFGLPFLSPLLLHPFFLSLSFFFFFFLLFAAGGEVTVELPGTMTGDLIPLYLLTVTVGLVNYAAHMEVKKEKKK